MNESARPKVSIIMLNWNGFPDTSENLDSLRKLTYPNYDVTVVDNGSAGDDVELLKQKYGDFVDIVTNDKNYGISEGNNIGIRRVLPRNPDYILLLNNDLVVAPDFLDELMSFADSEPDMGIASPVIYCYHERDRVQYGGATTTCFGLRTRNLWGPGNDDSPKQCLFISAAAMLFKTEQLLRMGIMESTRGYFIFADDISYSLAALRSGKTLVYVPRSKVWHKGSRSLKRIGGVRSRWLMKDHLVLRYRFLTQGFLGRVPTSYCIYYFMWLFVYRPLGVPAFLLQNRDRKTIANLFKGTWEGLTQVLRHARRPGE